MADDSIATAVFEELNLADPVLEVFLLMKAAQPIILAGKQFDPFTFEKGGTPG